MKRLLDIILAQTLWLRGMAGPRLYGLDPLAQAATYRGWLWPLRLMLALRYLRHKQGLLHQYQAGGRFPLDRADLATRLYQRISQGPQPRLSFPSPAFAVVAPPRLPLFAYALRTPIFALLCLGPLCAGAFFLRAQSDHKALHQQLGQKLLRYADIAHSDREARVFARFIDLLVTRVGMKPEELRKAGADPKYRDLKGSSLEGPKEAGIYFERVSAERVSAAAKERQAARVEILALFPRDAPVRQQLALALDRMSEDGRKGDDIVADFAAVNRELDRARLGYRFVPTVLGDRCTGYLGDLDLRLFAENKVKADLGTCTTTLVLPYEVERYERYAASDGTFPVYRLRQLQTLPVIESALGLTYRRGGGSEVFLDRIRTFVSESLIPSLSPRGRTLIFPWMRGSSDIEAKAADVVQRSLSQIYSAEQLGGLRTFAQALVRVEGMATRARMHQAMMSMGHSRQQPQLMGLDSGSGDEGVRLGIDALTGFLTEELDRKDKKDWPQAPESLKELERQLADAVAIHEVQHQRTEQFRQAGLRATQLKRHRKHIGSVIDLDGILDEVGAYLVSIYYAPKLRHIVLTQLASYALSTMAEGGREYYAGRILLRAMAHPKRGASPPAEIPEGPLDVVKDYTSLAAVSDDDLADWAQAAYQDLFEERLPILHRLPE